MFSNKTFRKYLILFFFGLCPLIWIYYMMCYVENENLKKLLFIDLVIKSDQIDTNMNISINNTRKMPITAKFVSKEGWFPLTGFNKKADNTFPNDYTVADEHELRLNIQRYFVNSTKCKMPYSDPFSPESMRIYKPAKLQLCTTNPDLFHLSFDRNTSLYTLHVNETILLPFGNRIECNYSGISDKSSMPHSTVYFEKQHKLPQNLNGVIVQCHEKKNPFHINIIQKDAFPLVQVSNDKRERKFYSNQLKRQPSIIILGLDSMSRINFPRTMPMTAKFVSQEGWFPLTGFNKMADNTFPNVYTVLSGVTVADEHELRSKNYRNTKMIWTDYARAGYITAVTEDVISLPLFNDIYLTAPTHYYLRSVLLSIAYALKTYKKFGYDYCIGRRMAFSYVYDFCTQFLTRHILELDQPTFGFFWSCTFTHDFYNVAASLDPILMDYLHLFEQQKLFENSIVILMGDHGARFGPLLDLPDNFLEERLPLLYIYLPPWFRNTYPNYAQALAMNKDRLCSNYDLHNTLRHLLQLNATKPTMLPTLNSCPTSQSLLHPLPVERSCEDACIKEHWCTCNEFTKQSLDGEMYLLGKRVVYHMNRWMLMQRHNSFCQRLGLQDMEMAEKKMYEANGRASMYGSISIYRLRFRTYPDVGKFQATVRYNHELESIEDLHVPDISRLNSYKNSSECVTDKIAKKFCFCYPKTKLNAAMKEWQKLMLTTVAAF